MLEKQHHKPSIFWWFILAIDARSTIRVVYYCFTNMLVVHNGTKWKLLGFNGIYGTKLIFNIGDNLEIDYLTKNGDEWDKTMYLSVY